MRNNSLKLSNKMADLLPIRINYWQNCFEIIAPHFPHRRLLTIRLAILGSSSNRSLAQTPRINFRSVGDESRLSKGRSGWGKRFQRRNFNHRPPFSHALLGLICHITIIATIYEKSKNWTNKNTSILITQVRLIYAGPSNSLGSLLCKITVQRFEAWWLLYVPHLHLLPT